MTRPRTSTLVLLGTFVAVLALYLWVRPEPDGTTPQSTTRTTLVPFGVQDVPAEDATTSTSPPAPEPETTTSTTEEEEPSTTSTTEEGSPATSTTEDGDGRGASGSTTTSDTTDEP